MSISNPNIILILIFGTLLVGLGGCGGGGGSPKPTPKAIDTVAPALVNNTNSLVGEGGTDSITSSELSYRDSIQPTSSVTFTIVLPPFNGQLEKISNTGIPISQFTQSDIDAGSIIYKHARGNVSGDTIEFDVDDGMGNILSRQTFNIDIIPNITSPGMAFSGETVQLSWLNPLLSEFTGVEIRRRDDGFYPDSPTDGLLIYKSSLNEQQVDDIVTLPLNNGPQTRYYTIFSYGGNGVYSDGVRVGLYCDSGKCLTVPDLRELNRITSLQEVENLRKTLINTVWGVDALPGWLPNTVSDISDPFYTNAQSIKLLDLQMDFGLISRMRLFEPFTSNSRLIIYHGGHRGVTDREKEIIQRLLLEGFYVLQISMPITGLNYNPSNSFTSHDEFAALDRPMRFFLEPVAVGLNYVTSSNTFSGIYMMGISGGGWTTVVYSALDTRITASYPVAGSYPFYLKTQLGDSSIGDFEQTNPDFYQRVSYIELYVMGAANRRQLQIYNEFDTCCFEGSYSNTFKNYLQNSASSLGGALDIIVDDTVAEHTTSDFALEQILNDITLN